jgi:hypothetical protein
LITVDAVAKIQGAASSDVARKSAAGIRDELSRFIYAELLVPMSGVPRRGRRKQLCRAYPKLKQSLAALGIILEQAKS